MKHFELSQIKILVKEGKILWTEHIATRLRERGIKRVDVIECTENGKIIEQYSDDALFPSCLVLGKCKAGKPLHLVVGLDANEMCCMITAYRPDLDKWENDFMTRKEGN